MLSVANDTRSDASLSTVLFSRLPFAIVLSLTGALIVVALAVASVGRFKRDIAYVDTQARFIGAVVNEVITALETIVDNAISRVGPLPNSSQLGLVTLPGSLAIMSVIDAEGWLLATTGNARARVYLGDRYHFLIHREGGPDSSLFVGPPVQGRVSGIRTLQLTKSIWNEDDELISVFVASFVVSDLERILNDLPRPAGSELALFGTDGILRSASSGWTGPVSDQDLPDGSVWRCPSFFACSFTAVAEVPDRELIVLSSYSVELGAYVDGWAILALTFQVAAMLFAVREWRRRQRLLHVANMHALWAGSRTLRYLQLGQMAAGFAHEIGTPAQTITLAVGNLKRLLGSSDHLKDEIATKIERIEVAIGRIASLTDSVKSYRSREFANRSTLMRNIENAVIITKPMLTIDNVGIDIQGESSGRVGLSDDEVQTIIINLIENARKAIVEAGRPVRQITLQLKRGMSRSLLKF